MNLTGLTNHVSFHDSTLERVVKTGERLVLYLDSVAAPPNFVGDDVKNGYVVLEGVEIICDEASTRKLEYWIDTKASVEHPKPEHPLDEIMKNDLEGLVLEISGFGPSSGWVVWQIEAKNFQILWKSETRH